MKEILIKNYKNRRVLDKDLMSEQDKVILRGSINDFKSFGIENGQDLFSNVEIVLDSEEIKVSNFNTREDLDRYVKDFLGDNLTLNRRNGHKIIGTKEELDKLSLSKYSNIYGCIIKENE
jgi:hypothetical protein